MKKKSKNRVQLLVLAFGTLLFYFLSGSAIAEPQQITSELYECILSKNKIYKNQKFRRVDLVSRKTDSRTIPSNAVRSIGFFLGRRAAFNIRKGEILTAEHVHTADLIKWTKFDEIASQKYENAKPPAGFGRVFFPIRQIRSGHRVESGMLEARNIDQSKIPHGAITSLRMAFGRKVKRDIEQGRILLKDDLVPNREGH